MSRLSLPAHNFRSRFIEEEYLSFEPLFVHIWLPMVHFRLGYSSEFSRISLFSNLFFTFRVFVDAKIISVGTFYTFFVIMRSDNSLLLSTVTPGSSDVLLIPKVRWRYRPTIQFVLTIVDTRCLSRDKVRQRFVDLTRAYGTIFRAQTKLELTLKGTSG